MKTNSGYETLYLGSQVDLQQSDTIELVLFTDYQISLNNFKTAWQGLSSHNNIYTSDDHIFRIECGKDNILVFNVIYYLDENKKPLGCTVFEKPQSTNPLKESYIQNLIIEISIDTTTPTIFNVELTYELGTYFNSSEIPDKVNYPTKAAIKEHLFQRENYLRYTNDLEQLNHDSSVVLLTDSNLLTKNNFYNFKLCSPFTSLFYGKKATGAMFTYYNFRPYIFLYYRDDKDFFYRFTCLTLTNDYGKPNIVSQENLVGGAYYFKDFYVAGKYIISNKRPIYDLETQEDVLEYNCDIYADPLSYDPKILPLSEITEEDNIIPTPLDYSLERKIGPWNIYSNEKSYTWISPFGSIKTSKEEKTFLITDRVFLSQEDFEDLQENPAKFTSFYCATPEGTLRTNDYFKNDYTFSSSKNYRIIPGCPRKMYCGESGSSKYYGKYIFTYNNQGGMLSNQILDGLRHKAILNYDIPDEIIGGIGGIVFYIDKDKFIKYL